MNTNEPRRFYGTDETDEVDTFVEATERPDGTLHFSAVVVNKQPWPRFRLFRWLPR